MLSVCSTEELRTVLETNGAIAFAVAVGADGRFTIAAVNGRFERTTGLRHADTTGRGWADVLPPAGADRLAAQLRRCADSGAATEFDTELDFPAGRCWWRTALVPLRHGDGTVHHLIGTAHDIGSQRAAESALRSTERRMAALFETVNAGILVMDAGTYGLLLANPRAEALFGYSAGDLLNRRYIDLLHPDDVPSVVQKWREAMSGDHKPYCAERRFRRADGTILMAEVAASFFKDPASGRLLWISAIQNLSPARLAQQRLRDALETASDGFALFDAEDRLVLSNAAFASVYGTGPEALVGRGFEDLQRLAFDQGTGPMIPSGDSEAWLAERLERHRLADGSTFLAPTRHQRWFLIRERRTAEGWTVLVRTDVTEFKQREQALAEHETLLRHGAALAKLGYWVWDEVADRCLYCSEELAAIHEMAVDDFYADLGSSESVVARLHPDDRAAYREAMARGLERGDPVDIEVRLFTRSGRLRHVREKAEFVRDAQGRVTRSLGIVQDVTDHKTRELELERARALAEASNRTKSQFLAHMSHELRTPLNAIIGFSELIQLQVFGPLGSERYGGYIDDIQASARHLLELINDLLDLAKIEAGRFELDERPVDLGRLLGRSARLVEDAAARKRLEFVIGADPLLMALGDERALHQVMVNLLSNAVKFTPERGRVEARVALRDGAATLTVSDTGVGIPPEDILRVAEPFAQASLTRRSGETGTGLGLPIVHSLVALHGGKVAIDSTVGRGTTVTVRLPAERTLSALA